MTEPRKTEDVAAPADKAVVVMAAGKDAAPMLKKVALTVIGLLTGLLVATVWLAVETRGLRAEVARGRVSGELRQEGR